MRAVGGREHGGRGVSLFPLTVLALGAVAVVGWWRVGRRWRRAGAHWRADRTRNAMAKMNAGKIVSSSAVSTIAVARRAMISTIRMRSRRAFPFCSLRDGRPAGPGWRFIVPSARSAILFFQGAASFPPSRPVRRPGHVETVSKDRLAWQLKSQHGAPRVQSLRGLAGICSNETTARTTRGSLRFSRSP